MRKIKHYHLIRPDGEFSQMGHADGEEVEVPEGHALVYVKKHTNDPHCHRYVGGKLVFDPEKRARLDRETAISLMSPLDLYLKFIQPLEQRVEELTKRKAP